MIEVQRLPRKFTMGATELADPAPSLPLAQVHELFVQQFPIMRQTHIFESDGRLSDCGGFIEYTIVLPPVKTQG